MIEDSVTSKRVLVLSNNCFSLSNSNGRTLGNLFCGWPKENLAQFCVIAQDPNWDICSNYYCLEDRTVLKSFIHCKKAAGRLLYQANPNDVVNSDTLKISRKTVGKVLIRELVWACKRWKSSSFVQWINDFNPELIVLQFGDSIFMQNIAYYISRERKIPLVIYNTEGYYFFSRNWYHTLHWDNLIFRIYKSVYNKVVRKLMMTASHCVYLNDKLKADYDKEFGVNSTVIYNSSSLEVSKPQVVCKKDLRISYLGNLDLYRDSALIEVAEVLREINPEFKVDVYGKASDSVKQRFESAQGVDYHGFISYGEVVRVIKESDILLHVETERGNKEWQLQYAFTTKIADSVSSGRCFIVYAPKELACSQYVERNRCGCVASDKEELRKILNDVIFDDAIRNKIINNSLEIARQNHNLQANANTFRLILHEV